MSEIRVGQDRFQDKSNRRKNSIEDAIEQREENMNIIIVPSIFCSCHIIIYPKDTTSPPNKFTKKSDIRKYPGHMECVRMTE